MYGKLRNCWAKTLGAYFRLPRYTQSLLFLPMLLHQTSLQ